MADRTPGPSSSSSSMNETNRKRRPSNIDTSPLTQSHKRSRTGAASHASESPVAGSSQTQIGARTSPTKKSAKRPVFARDSPAGDGMQTNPSGHRPAMPVARKSASGAGWRPNKTKSPWAKPTGSPSSPLKQTRLSSTAPTRELSSSSENENELPAMFKRVSQKAQRRATTGSVNHEVINLISDDEDDDNTQCPPKVPTRPDPSQNRHAVEVHSLGKSKDEPILISDSEDEAMVDLILPEPTPMHSPQPERIPKQPTQKIPTSKGLSTYSSPTKETSPKKSASQLKERMNEIFTSDDEGSPPRHSNSSSKPESVASASTDPIVPALGDMSLGKSSPESEALPTTTQIATKRTGPKPQVRVKGVLYGNSFFSRNRAETSSSAVTSVTTTAISSVAGSSISRRTFQSSAPSELAKSSTVSARSSPETDDQQDRDEQEHMLEDNIVQTPSEEASSREISPPGNPFEILPLPKSTSHRMHPSPRPKKVDLTDVINSAYARNAQSHVDLTQDDDEIPPSQVLSVPAPKILEIDTYRPETIGSKHNSQRLAEDAHDAFDHLPFPDHDPAIVADEPEEDRAQASSATSATNEHSDVEMDDEESQPKTRRSTRVKKQVIRGTLNTASLALLERDSRSTSAYPLDLFHRRARGRPRRRVVSPTSSRTSSDDFASTALLNISGIQVLNWRNDGGRVAKEFCQTTMLAKDLPHELVDRVNQLPRHMRTADIKRKIFKAIICQNTAREEPGAPPIDIVNTVDNEPTPAYEFHYTNLMWHSERVGKPDLSKLRGCGCRGVCNPRKCACAAKQQEGYLDNDPRLRDYGFVYDKNKKLRVHQYPIFECNAFCGCDEDLCQNRVVQNGRTVAIELKKTQNKGWGVFAGQSIPANTFVGIYSGEFITDEEAQERGILYNNFGRTYLFDLDFWYLQEKNHGRPKYCIDAYHAGNFTRYLNHSCDPNCVINPCYINEPDLEKPLLTIFTCKDVAAGEELCFSYFGEMTEEELGQNIEDDAVYAPCRCGAKKCTGRMWK